MTQNAAALSLLSPTTAGPERPRECPEEFPARLCWGQSASDHPPQLPELLPTLLLFSSFPAPPLPQEQGEQGSVEGGADTQTPRDSPGLQEMKSPQDLGQGSREGFREAAGSGPPSEGLVGGCKGLKAAARILGGIWLQLRGAQGSDLY